MWTGCGKSIWRGAGRRCIAGAIVLWASRDGFSRYVWQSLAGGAPVVGAQERKAPGVCEDDCQYGGLEREWECGDCVSEGVCMCSVCGEEEVVQLCRVVDEC